MVTDTYLVKKIQMMQEELESLKRIVLKKSTKKPEKFRGIWKGVDFSDDEIEEPRASWLKE